MFSLGRTVIGRILAGSGAAQMALLLFRAPFANTAVAVAAAAVSGGVAVSGNVTAIGHICNIG